MDVFMGFQPTFIQHVGAPSTPTYKHPEVSRGVLQGPCRLQFRARVQARSAQVQPLGRKSGVRPARSTWGLSPIFAIFDWENGD